MLNGNNADGNCSDKKKEGGENLRTLECLRGRLLAERTASRVAKEETELMGKKLIELENRLREETKSKNKAQRKFKVLIKKLESLKINYALEDSEPSISSLDNLESSCGSSSISSFNGKPEEDEKPKTQITDCDKCKIIEEIEHNSSESTSSTQTHNDASLENSCKSESGQNYEDSKNIGHSSKSSMGEMEMNGGQENEEEDSVDNSLALVLVPPSMQAPSQKSEVKIVNKSVSEVLDALRQAREKIQSSMERRHMIKVGLIGSQIC